MQRVHPTDRLPLLDVAGTRAQEREAAAGLPPHTLMARAGTAVARWTRALYPHARHVWVACGPGNNGGDGLVAAAELLPWAHAGGARVSVSWCGNEAHLPADAAWALSRARAAGVPFVDHAPADFDVAIDALLGLGARPVPRGDGSPLGLWLQALRDTPRPVLHVDLPSGLDADTGCWNGDPPSGPRHTLSLLGLKPGLFTAQGRDAVGDLWWDDLGTALPPAHGARARLNGWPAPSSTPGGTPGPHDSHKGSRGDVVVLGGQDLSVNGAGMSGAALLAGRAALHGGAGRVFVALLGDDAPALHLDPLTPELMLRTPARLWQDGTADQACVVCGCGGGEAVASVLPTAITRAARLVLDADALNLIARDTLLQQAVRERATRGRPTLLTPHPLEAARLLGTTRDGVQTDRLRAATDLADRYQAMVVLKGSGSVLAAPGQQPLVNVTGNARLATAGTGDVLAGLLGAAWAPVDADLWPACAAAVHQHGHWADVWDESSNGTLTAAALVRRLCPL